MRMTQYHGFPKGYQKLLFKKEVCPTCKHEKLIPLYLTRKVRHGAVTGMFDEVVHLRLEYVDKNGIVKYREEVQSEMWNSGPCIFMKVVDIYGNSVLAWDQKTIDSA